MLIVFHLSICKNGRSLELAERLEQLRWIENGYKITVDFTEYDSIGIDTPEDLLKLTNKA